MKNMNKKEEKTMSYVVKDLPEIKLVEELLRFDPDVREKLEMKSNNKIKYRKEKNKYTDKNLIICGTRCGKGVSVIPPKKEVEK